eukprot:1954426-Heterocapsa_arctica.AAC.1
MPEHQTPGTSVDRQGSGGPSQVAGAGRLRAGLQEAYARRTGRTIRTWAPRRRPWTTGPGILEPREAGRGSERHHGHRAAWPGGPGLIQPQRWKLHASPNL